MGAISQYLRGCIEELHHVRWPTRQQAIRLSLIVIVFIIVSASILGIVDSLLTQFVTGILA